FAHGSFDVVNGQARPGIARLTSSGALDTGFAPGVEHLIFVHASADGSVLAYSQENVLRLSPTGRIDATFTAVKGEHFLVTPSGIVHAITHEAVTLGSIQEYTRYWISRHNADGSSTGSAPMTILVDNRSTTLQPRGENEIALFGAFNEVNGQPRASLATVNVSGVTPKILVAAPVWETGGSASVTLVRTGDNSEALTVRYSTADLTARAGVHYEAASGELKFPPNVSTGTVPLRLPDNPTASADTMLNLVFRTPGGIAINESPLTILNDDPGFLVSELFLPDQKTVALRFTGRGTPNLESSKTLEEWLAYERQPSKREILVPDTTRSDMEFFTFTVEE
ncbi:MAG TPA: Calx-beta domain-containing protein, partial [Methylomirabilota bacterium]|nr:Calx-beta domain-containing protein [Methylomirabilota bacterium]